MSTYDWEIENGGTLGEGKEVSPVQFPRSDIARDADGTVYKGGASQHEDPLDASALNTDGNTNVPRHNDPEIDYYGIGDGKDVYPLGYDEGSGKDEQG